MNINEITLYIDGTFASIELAKIHYFRSYGNYVKLAMQKNTLVAKITTRELEDSLPEELFLRIHKSYIVNIQKIQVVTDNGILMDDQTKLPICKTYKQYVRRVLSK